MILSNKFQTDSRNSRYHILIECIQVHLIFHSVRIIRVESYINPCSIMGPKWNVRHFTDDTWWRHQMETLSALLAVCAGNSPVLGVFTAQRPVTRSFDVFFDLRLNKRLSKQSWGWWFETLSRQFWRHCNDFETYFDDIYFALGLEIINVFFYHRLFNSVIIIETENSPLLSNKACSFYKINEYVFVLKKCQKKMNLPVTGEFPAQRPVTWSFDVLFDLRLNKRLSKQSWGWWFGTPLCPLWRHCNVLPTRELRMGTHHVFFHISMQ